MTLTWMRWRIFYYALSFLVIVAAIVPIALQKLQPALEFTGGARLIVEVPGLTPENVASISGFLQKENLTTEPIKTRADGEVEMLFKEIDERQKAQLLFDISRISSTSSEISFQNIGPSLGKELFTKTIYAIALGVLVILLYLWWQFSDWRFGVAGVVAMLHDSIILVGSFAWLGWYMGVKVDTLFVTALLTTLSFSVHDTIVVFNRVEELLVTSKATDVSDRADLAMTQTLTRSLNNSITILFMLLTLILLGGETTRSFAIALFVGTTTGTYSSTFVALPLYVDLVRLKEFFARRKATRGR